MGKSKELALDEQAKDALGKVVILKPAYIALKYMQDHLLVISGATEEEVRKKMDEKNLPSATVWPVKHL